MASKNTGRLQALSTVAGRHRTDDGLYLYVRDGARPIWLYRYVGSDRKRRDMSIGRFESMSLPDARAEVLRWNAERKEGRDPIDIRKSAMEQAEMASRAAVTLREYAIEYHALRLSTWKNEKHAAQWLSSLNHLGKLLALPLFRRPSGCRLLASLLLVSQIACGTKA